MCLFLWSKYIGSSVAVQFINAKLFEKIGVSIEITDLATVFGVVTSFLGSCTLTSTFAVRGSGECVGRCQLDYTQCRAWSYTPETGCTLCLAISNQENQLSNGSSLELRPTMVNIHLLIPFMEFRDGSGKTLYFCRILFRVGFIRNSFPS